MKNEHRRFRVTSLPPKFVQSVRIQKRDEHGHTLHPRTDQERHQCRACLKLTQPGEPVLLLAYSPFQNDTAYSEVGPIFIHEQSCTPHPPDHGYPNELPRHEVVLRAYNQDHEIEDAELVGDSHAEDVITDLLGNPQVAYVHARNSAWGCFMFQIDRS